ncbi:MAG: radical SAM protein [Acidobacteriota bacterium]
MKTTKARVYLVDLRHNYAGVLTSDCMPLGIAYMKAVMDRDLPEVRSQMFAYPERLWDALRQEPPDVLMLSNYLWNEELSLCFARLAKRLCPETLVVMGGPNIPQEPSRQVEQVAAHPEVDLYVLGEADFLAADIVRHFLDSGQSIKRMGEREIPSSIYRRPDGQLVRQQLRARHRGLDEIPSPWLTGIQDAFFDGKLAPMIETNRGCPFTCTFCVQGDGYYTKVNYFPPERIREELEYIARRVKAVSPWMGMLRVADANYGMFERDVEISGWIGEMQKRYGYPTFIDATTGKNRPERIIESVEKVSGALVVYQAVQSLNEDVLRNIKRSNIKLDAYEKVMIHVRGRGLRSNSDLIVGLPGETLQSHLDAIHKLIDSGTNQMHNLQLILLKGSELERLDVRRQFAFASRFRLGPKNFGVYGGEKVFDIEEVVVGTSTMSFDDYLQTRKFHLVSSVFWNDSWFEDVVSFAQKFGVKRSQWFDAMLPAMESGPESVRRFLASFVTATINELFPTQEACLEFHGQEANFLRLAEGEIGDNLMYRYRALASFYLWPGICEVAMEATRKLLIERGAKVQVAGIEEFWRDFALYEQCKHAHGRTVEEVLSPAEVELGHDIAGWLADGMPIEVAPYRLARPERFRFELTEEGARELAAAFKVWTPTLRGMTKMVTRIQMGWQIRRCGRPADGIGRPAWTAGEFSARPQA